MKLAKPHVDLGLYTVERDAMPSFWQQEVGLVYQEMLPVGGGVQQHAPARHERVGDEAESLA